MKSGYCASVGTVVRGSTVRELVVLAILACAQMACIAGGADDSLPRAELSPTEASEGGVGGASTEVGAVLGLFFDEEHATYGSLLWEVRRAGLSSVLFVVPVFQENARSGGPADLSAHRKERSHVLRSAIGDAHEMGLNVAVMPVLRFSNPSPGEWRGVLNPPDVDAWVDAWGRAILPYVRIAANRNAHAFVIGSEFSSLEKHTEPWSELVRRLRDEFDGTLLYSANWDHYDRPEFWDELDAIGVSAYFSPPEGLGVLDDPASWSTYWSARVSELEVFASEAGKPLWITEVGFRSVAGASNAPWNHAVHDDSLSLSEQAWSYHTLLPMLLSSETLEELYLWNVFGPGGSRCTDYTWRGKPASVAISDIIGER